mgnify:CR=1 FL=1
MAIWNKRELDRISELEEELESSKLKFNEMVKTFKLNDDKNKEIFLAIANDPYFKNKLDEYETERNKPKVYTEEDKSRHDEIMKSITGGYMHAKITQISGPRVIKNGHKPGELGPLILKATPADIMDNELEDIADQFDYKWYRRSGNFMADLIWELFNKTDSRILETEDYSAYRSVNFECLIIQKSSEDKQ